MRVIACVLLLVGCGVDVNGGIADLGAQLHPECGWVTHPKDEPLPLVGEGEQQWRMSGSNCGLLPVGQSACDMEPARVLPANLPTVEVYRSGRDGVDCKTTLEPTSAP